MKLLLTSNGLSNDSIATAFANLIGKDPSDSKVAFIPSAANPSRENKDWLIKDMSRILEQGYSIDIVELTALSQEEIKDILQGVDAIFIGGGNSFYLSYWMQKTGLFDLLPELLSTKVYAGISAGSMIAGSSLKIASQALKHAGPLKDDDYDELGPIGQSSAKTLELVDFLFRPHLNSPNFPHVQEDSLREKAKDLDQSIYALDDQSALKIIDGKAEVVTEGNYLLLEPRA